MMTAVVRHAYTPPPAVTRLGLVVPGLGHLLVGEAIVGLGLLSLDLLLFWSAWAGVPRLGTVLFGPGGAVLIHPVIALAAWPLIAIAVWRTAMRRAYPRPMTDEEENSNRQIFLRTLRRHRTGMIGLFGVLFMVTLTVLTPLIAPHDPLAVSVGPQNAPPSWEFWMGTDDFGRDVFSRLLFGGRISLAIGFVSVGIAASMGTLLGAIAGYAGGTLLDRLIMFVVDVMLSFPKLVLLLAIVGLYRFTGAKGIFMIVAILGLTAWMGIARIVRSEILSLKQRDFVQAAQALGLSRTRILLVHLIPNALAPVIVFCSLLIGGTMLTEATLSFLGLGVPPPIATWGVMVNDGRDPLRVAPWISVFPGLAIMVSVLSFNLLGDGLRDGLDPKLRG